MSAEIVKNLPATLDGLAEAIRANVKEAERVLKERSAVLAAAETAYQAIRGGDDPLRVERGRLLIEARPHFETKQAFADWCRMTTNGSVSDAYACMKLAGADDPHAAAKDERENAAERKRKSRAAQSVTGGNVTDKPVTFVPPNAMTDKIRITTPEPAATEKTVTVPDTPETSTVVEDGLTAAQAAFLRLDAEQRTPFLDWAMTQSEAQTIPTEPETSTIDVLTAFRALWARASGDECKQIIDGTLKPHFRAEYRKAEREERQAAVEQATRREEVPAPTEDDPAAREIFAKLRSAGTEWIGPSARDRLGIDEDEIDRLLKEGALRQHPTLPCSVGLPA